MGLGNSKLNAAEEEKVPTLFFRFEVFKKYRNTESTPSKKKLLKYADQEDDKSRSLSETESEDKVSSSKEIQTPDEETGARVIAAQKLSRVAPMPNSEGKIVEENHPNKDKLNLVVEMVEAEVKAEEEKSARLVEEANNENMQSSEGDELDDEDESEEVGRFLCPGSPSFRIYCSESEKINENECKSHQKTAASKCSKEVLQESEPTPKRKGIKKRFGVVKSLLKVRSCYHPMCICTSEDRNLVTAKATK